VVRRLAEATLRAGRSGDVPGYLRADIAFHRCLLELTSDPAHSEVARVLLTPDRARARQMSDYLMAREAREHSELVSLLACGLVSLADHLLRHHLARLAGSRPASARLAKPDSVSTAGA
jgi:DNA-binding GntR family transcriptional regulator